MDVALHECEHVLDIHHAQYLHDTGKSSFYGGYAKRAHDRDTPYFSPTNAAKITHNCIVR